MYNNIRSWVEAILDWAADNDVSIDRFTDTHFGLNFPGEKKLCLHLIGSNWRVSTLEGYSMDDSDHIVIDETADHELRIRRGPIGKLKVVEYRPNFDDGQKLVSASCRIAKIMPGDIRESFMNTFVRDDMDDEI